MNSTFKASTDTEHKITVESQLLYAMWLQGRGYAGFDAEFEVKTVLVGNGAKVTVTCRTEKGKKLDKVEGAIINNRYRGKVLVPTKVEPDDYIFLEVKLPKHGLSDESNSIPVSSPIEVSSMQWSKTEISRNEEVMLTCVFTNGVEEGDDVTVIVKEYDSDGNHNTVVSIPTTIKNSKMELNWKFIYQHDTNTIPTEEELAKYGKSYTPPKYFFVVMVDNVPIGNKLESGLLLFNDTFAATIWNGRIKADASDKYVIAFADGSEKTLSPNENGQILIDKIPPGPAKIWPQV